MRGVHGLEFPHLGRSCIDQFASAIQVERRFKLYGVMAVLDFP